MINKISSLNLVKQPEINKSLKNEGFEQFLNSALNLVNNTNALQKEAQDISKQYILGKVDNIHNVMIAQQKANVALQFTVQVRDKLLDAYNEIMRMPL